MVVVGLARGAPAVGVEVVGCGYVPDERVGLVVCPWSLFRSRVGDGAFVARCGEALSACPADSPLRACGARDGSGVWVPLCGARRHNAATIVLATCTERSRLTRLEWRFEAELVEDADLVSTLEPMLAHSDTTAEAQFLNVQFLRVVARVRFDDELYEQNRADGGDSVFRMKNNAPLRAERVALERFSFPSCLRPPVVAVAESTDNHDNTLEREVAPTSTQLYMAMMVAAPPNTRDDRPAVEVRALESFQVVPASSWGSDTAGAPRPRASAWNHALIASDDPLAPDAALGAPIVDAQGALVGVLAHVGEAPGECIVLPERAFRGLVERAVERELAHHQQVA